MANSVLVIDDEARLVNLVRGYLEQEGYAVHSASNGCEALFVAREQRPDLIVLDRMMPEMEKLEKQIKQDAVESKISFTYRGISAVHVTGFTRVYWDAKGLGEYAEENPEIKKFGKESETPSYVY